MKSLCSRLYAALGLLLIATAASATTKGLNQIVTPDIQPPGQLSLSLQLQDARIGNATELQEELGITKRFEVAVFEGFQPSADYFNVEYSLLKKNDWLLSTGLLNYSPRYGGLEPFIEGGYYRGRQEMMLGEIDIANQVLPLAGYAYQQNKKLLLQADFEGGRSNFLTLGFTYSVTPNFNINPAIYINNERPGRMSAYVVFTWTTTAWVPRKPHSRKVNPNVKSGEKSSR